MCAEDLPALSLCSTDLLHVEHLGCHPLSVAALNYCSDEDRYEFRAHMARYPTLSLIALSFSASLSVAKARL